VVTPAATTTISAPASALKTTDGLVNVIPPSPTFASVTTTYTVQKGETLSAIAAKNGVTVAAIKAANKDYFDKLAAENKANKTDVEVETGAVLNIKTVTAAQPLNYTVQKGETLSGIAYNYYGTMSAAQIAAIQNANAAYFKSTNGVLEAGAVITLPAAGLLANPVTQSSLGAAAGMYLVKAGDTLADLAVKYYGDMTQWKKIYDANRDKVTLIGGSAMIYTGQWLVIPQ